MIWIAIWVLIGACFGWPRARARYRIEYAIAEFDYPVSARTDIGYIQRRAFFAAASEFLIWMALGALSGLSFVAWVLLKAALESESKIKKLRTGDALILSIVIFILGAIALDTKSRKLRELALASTGGENHPNFGTHFRVSSGPNSARSQSEHDDWERWDQEYEEAKAKLISNTSFED